MEDFESLSEKVARLTNECELLRDENSRLRELLNQQPTKTEGCRSDSRSASETSNQTFSASPDAKVTAVAVPARAAPELSTPEKISLFRALFRGREDVFAVRWEAGEKAGYSPASIRDWTALRGVSKSEWKKRAKAQYSSLNDPDGLAEIDGMQGFAASAAPGVVADFPLYATRIMTVAAGDAFLIEDFRQQLVMELAFVLRGE